MKNPAIETMLNRKSIRKYTEKMPPDEVITTIARAGQQAPFAAQLYSLILRRNQKRNPFHAPLLFTVCIDCHKLELIHQILPRRMREHSKMGGVFQFKPICISCRSVVNKPAGQDSC